MIGQILAALAATLAEDLAFTEDQIARLFQRFVDRVPTGLRDRLTRNASVGLLKIV